MRGLRTGAPVVTGAGLYGPVAGAALYGAVAGAGLYGAVAGAGLYGAVAGARARPRVVAGVSPVSGPRVGAGGGLA
ncbi:hypothetical protein [Streptomyces sp. NPDC050585]|uniref:hypothetical protein n=1 Tax=Streptomyces sp. NPDC050585 TaxID=3365632 RepID=UPI0037937B59